MAVYFYSQFPFYIIDRPLFTISNIFIDSFSDISSQLHGDSIANHLLNSGLVTCPVIARGESLYFRTFHCRERTDSFECLDGIIMMKLIT